MTDEPIESISGYGGLTRIGMGGSGVVYRARQLAFDRDVAVKVLRGDFDESARRRFLREARLTGRLTGHPHVVTALDAGTTDGGSPYLAMDLFERGSLQDRLADSGPFPPAEVAAIGAKIAGALADAHDLGMVHRDVKPNNILVSRFGEPALADFGVAVVPDSATLVTMFRAFTPHHAAPEVLAGADATTQSDVYSLGSTLYHLLTGRPPFDDGDDDGAQLSALMFRIVNTPAPPLDCPELPELAGIVMRALAKNPAERPESAAAMAAELGLLVGGGMRLSGTSLTMPPLNSADPTHRAQPEGAGPVVGGMPGAVIGEVPGAVIGGVSRTAMAAGPGPHGTVEDLGPEEVTVQGTGAQGGFDASDGVADTSGPVYAPTAQQPPVFPSTAPDPPRSAAGFEAPPQDDPVEVPRPATFGPGFTPDPSDQRGTDRRRRPLIIGASAAAAVVVAIGAIALSRGSSSSPSSGNGARTGAAMGAGGGDGSGQSTDASSRPSGQDLAAGGGPMPSAPGSASSSTSGSGANRPGNAPSGSAGSATHPPTSAPGGAAQPSTTQPSASSAPSTSAPKPSTTTKPPSTSSSSKNMSCTGWHITHVVADDGSGYAASGTFNMRSGPYAACSAVGKFTTGQHMYIWCHVTNGYGNVWVYGRIDGTNTPAWESLDNFKSGATLGPAC